MFTFHKTHKYPLQKIIAYSGLLVVLFGGLSSIWYTLKNQGFVADAFSLSYYLQYVIILGGGFATGYLLTRKGSRASRAYVGSGYALLCMMIFTLLFAVQFVINLSFGTVPFPLGRILFEGMPIAALLLTILIAYFLQFRRGYDSLTPASKRTFVTLFVAAQIYDVANMIYWMTNASASFAQQPLWTVIAGYILNPLIVSLIAWFAIGQFKNKLDRLFAASFVGILSYTFGLSLWNFSSDPEVNAANAFMQLVILLTVIVDVLLIALIRRSAKNN